MTTAAHIAAARIEADRRTIAFGQRKNDEAAAAITKRGSTRKATDWKDIADQLRADGRLA